MSIGDSLELARKAREFSGDVIAFCGVWFMAETAKVLNPDRIVVVPDREASCSLVDSLPGRTGARIPPPHPDHVIVSYINTSIEVKAESDILCTSRNAVEVVNSIPREKPILFLPDVNLGNYVQQADRAREHADLAGHLHRARDVSRRAGWPQARAEHPDAAGGRPSGMPAESVLGHGRFHRLHIGHHRVLRGEPAPASSSS